MKQGKQGKICVSLAGFDATGLDKFNDMFLFIFYK